MATYKEIHGVKVQYRDSDATAVEGDVWYNASFGTLKMYVSLGAWASGGALNTPRGESFGHGAGTQTAAQVAGGSSPATSASSENVEHYDGSSWTEVADINTARVGAVQDGVQTASFLAAGYSTAYVGITESWNGTSWTEVADLSTARAYQGGTRGASATAGLVVAGYNGSDVDNVEKWDGSSWTEVAEVNSARRKAGGFGTSTAAIAVGSAPSATNLVESWDGSSWTETTENNSSRGAQGTAGSQTDGLIFGAEQAPVGTTTESWDGSSWTEVADLSANRGNAPAGGTGAAAFLAGGAPGGGVGTATEEFTVAASIETVAFD